MLGRDGGDAITYIGKADQAVEQMISVRPLSDQVEIEVDLCWSKGRKRHPSLAAAGSSGSYNSSVELSLDRLDLVFLRSEL